MLSLETINNIEALLTSNQISYQGSQIGSLNRILLDLQRERQTALSLKGASSIIPNAPTPDPTGTPDRPREAEG